jgi:hypothetical protein
MAVFNKHYYLEQRRTFLGVIMVLRDKGDCKTTTLVNLKEGMLREIAKYL